MSDTNTAFMQASRLQLRFETGRGHLTTEDLWELSLKDLDAIAVTVDSKTTEKKSFLENPDRKASQAAAANELRLEILKTVIGVRQDENKASRAATETARQKEFLKSLLEKKKIDQLEGLSMEDIEAQLAALG